MEQQTFMDYYNLVKDSPILDEEYYLNLRNLCDTIDELSRSIAERLEWIESSAADIQKRHIEDTRRLSFQISTIAGIIKEKVSSSDYADLGDLFCYLKNAELFNENTKAHRQN